MGPVPPLPSAAIAVDPAAGLPGPTKTPGRDGKHQHDCETTYLRADRLSYMDLTQFQTAYTFPDIPVSSLWYGYRALMEC
jgi:hypothetical protein